LSRSSESESNQKLSKNLEENSFASSHFRKWKMKPREVREMSQPSKSSLKQSNSNLWEEKSQSSVIFSNQWSVRIRTSYDVTQTSYILTDDPKGSTQTSYIKKANQKLW
jgi:hypothetical protein